MQLARNWPWKWRTDLLAENYRLGDRPYSPLPWDETTTGRKNDRTEGMISLGNTIADLGFVALGF